MVTTKVVMPHFLELRRLSLATRYSLVSYPEHILHTLRTLKIIFNEKKLKKRKKTWATVHLKQQNIHPLYMQSSSHSYPTSPLLTTFNIFTVIQYLTNQAERYDCNSGSRHNKGLRIWYVYILFFPVWVWVTNK